MVARPAISVAMPEDALALRALRAAVAKDMARQFGEGPWSEIPSHAQVRRQLRASSAILARQGEEVIGTVRLVSPLPGVFDFSAFTPATNPLYVLGLAVAPWCRGQGVGRQLMDAAKEMARARGSSALWLDAFDHEAGAGSFYLKCGFTRVSRTEGRGIPLIFFEWLALS